MTLCTICGGFDRLTTVQGDGLRLNVMPDCYAIFARTCYECGFGIYRFRVEPGMTAVLLPRLPAFTLNAVTSL